MDSLLAVERQLDEIVTILSLCGRAGVIVVCYHTVDRVRFFVLELERTIALRSGEGTHVAGAGTANTFASLLRQTNQMKRWLRR